MKIYPVVHYRDHQLAMDELGMLKEEGADGAFLISHTGGDLEVVRTARLAKPSLGDFPLGINLLSSPPLYACKVAQEIGLSMVWADNMGVNSDGVNDDGLVLSLFAKNHPAIALYASVAFKYQPREVDPATAARNALKAGFIPTTSGDSTGVAPSLVKIAQMSVEVGGRLAVASGMNAQNLRDYLNIVDAVLVSTGIALDEHRTDPIKLRELLAIARAKDMAKPLT